MGPSWHHTHTMRTLLAIILALASTLSCAAQPTPADLAAEVSDNVSVEYVECAAYFAIVQGAVEKSSNAASAIKYSQVSDKAAQFGLLAAQQSRSADMANKVTLARFGSNMTDMRQVIENNYSNIALLTSKYSDKCVDAMANSEALILRWTEKISAKYQKPDQR